MILRRALPIVFPALVFTTACTAILGVEDVPDQASADGGTGGPTGDASPEAAPNDALASAISAYATAFCNKASTCQPRIFDYGYRDISECTTAILAEIAIAQAAPGNGITLDAANACTTTITNATCDAAVDGDPSALCVVKGTKQVGERCVNDAQCVSDLCDTDATTCRTCVAVPEPGAPCTASLRCGPGFGCNIAGVCVAPSKLDDFCSNQKPCGAHLACVNGSCKTLPAAQGATCDPAAGGCDFLRGFACNSDDNQCLSFIVNGAGGACGFSGESDDQPKLCRRGGSSACSDLSGGICAAPPTQGQPCGSNGSECLSPLICVANVCALPPPASFCQ